MPSSRSSRPIRRRCGRSPISRRVTRVTPWRSAVRLVARSRSTAFIRVRRHTGSSRTRCATSSTRSTARQFRRFPNDRAAIKAAARYCGGNRQRRAATAIPLPFLLAAVSLLLPAVFQSQAVPRTDTPRAGTLRLTFEPVITTWELEFTPQGRTPIGATLPATVFIRQEQRVTPLMLEWGITKRLAIGAKAPLVRVNSRQNYNLDSLGQPDSASQALDSLLNDPTYAYGSLATTPRHLHYFAGDMEVQAKYRLID